MRIFKPALKVLLALLVFFAMNAAVAFALIPFGSKSEIMWFDYRLQDSIDTLIVGTSLGERGFNPVYIDDECGSRSFNMCTPSQTIEESIMAVEKASAEHAIKRVVLAFDMNVAEDANFPTPSSPFILGKDEGEPLEFAKDVAFCLTDERCYKGKESLNWVFPWVKNHVKINLPSIERNVNMKLRKMPVLDAAGVNDKGWNYYGSGYGNYEKTIDKNKGATSTYSSISGKRELDSRKLDSIRQLCKFCKDRNIDLMVVFMPWPAYSVFDYGNQYFEKTEELKELVEGCGQSFINMELAKPELFDASNDKAFADNQHMNDVGAQAASEALGRLIVMRESGQDTDSLFRTNADFDEEMAYVDMVKLTAKADGSRVDLKAKALAGSKAKVEYKFFIKSKDATKCESISDWSTDCEMQYDVEDRGKCVFRVNARLVGSDAHWERYREVSVEI